MDTKIEEILTKIKKLEDEVLKLKSSEQQEKDWRETEDSLIIIGRYNNITLRNNNINWIESAEMLCPLYIEIVNRRR